MEGVFFGWWAVAAAFVITAATVGVFYRLGVFFLPIMAELGWSRAVLSGVTLAGGLTYAATVPVAGWLADRYGFRPVMAAAAQHAGPELHCVLAGGARLAVASVRGRGVRVGVSGRHCPFSVHGGRWRRVSQGTVPWMGSYRPVRVVRASVPAGSIFLPGKRPMRNEMPRKARVMHRIQTFQGKDHPLKQNEGQAARTSALTSPGLALM